jgi:hypothetical protein
MFAALRRLACAAAAIAGVAALALPAAAIDEPFVSIVAVQTAAGWFFETDVDGPPGTIPDATLTPPVGSPLALICESSIGEDQCYRTDPPEDGAGFGSLAALLATYPVGSYLLSLDGGALTAQLTFEPVEPDGNISVTSPANGAVGVSATPTVAFTHDCDTCSFLFFEIDGFGATEGISLETTRIGPPPFPPTGTVDYVELESLEGPKPAALPDGNYRLATGAGRGALTDETFQQGGGFQYGTGAERRSTTGFTVPEPTGSLASAAILVALGACARRRRARGRPIRPIRERSR